MAKVLSYTIIFLCIALFTPTTHSSANQTDLLSLLALKAAIDVDPQGVFISSWNETTHFCSWNGISCSHRHPNRVVVIDLRSRGLVGSLSPYIGNLSFLRTINLQNNSFHGPIPQEIGRLRRVELIEFSNNSFFGPIPRNLSQCSNLVYLNLIDNNLSGVIPPELGVLHKLEDLGLARNNLSGFIPREIGNLTSLRQLSLSSCGLYGEIPRSFDRLQRLMYLRLSENDITGTIPLPLFNISSLVFLGAYSNRLEGSLPSNIGLTLPNLRFLSLAYNRFNGRVPISLPNATSLEQIVLVNNSFTGPLPRLGGLSRLHFLEASDNFINDDFNSLVTSLTNCTSLQILDLGFNLLHGRIPNAITNLSTDLYVLRVRNNQLIGRIPLGIENLVGLNVLSLSYNSLEGPIPDGIGKLTNLRRLFLGGSRLTNELPHSLGNLSLLTDLDLKINNFSGFVPKSLGKCTNLRSLDLSHNNLNGPVPPEIMNNLSFVSILLSLSDNAFNGSIPLEVGSLINLEILDMSNNFLSGLIPNSLSSCIRLQELYLNGNLLQGQIPEGLSSVSGLQDIDLSRNNLSGPVPGFLGVLPLQRLNLSFNRLQGEVSMIGVFRNVTGVSLQGNGNLCGGVSELNLRICPSSRIDKKNNLPTLLKVLIPTATFAVFLFVGIFLYKKWTRKNDSSPIPSFLETRFLRLSYADLIKATDGFAESHLIGSGRFGSVYKGVLEDSKSTLIAVKVLNLVVRGASKSFMAECNALRGIRHRNLVKILSVCESIDFQGNEFKALVYELKANGSLEKWLYHNDVQVSDAEVVTSLNMMQRLNIAIDIAEGIEYLHHGTELSIIHGDLKPSNVLLDIDMSACVGDFGLAKIISTENGISSTTIRIKGTIGYVPPEYGTSGLVSTAGDVYSYGIVVLEMFTNKRPTDDMPTDHATLHDFVCAALPDRVIEIVDPFVIRMENDMDNSKVEDCVASIMRIGVTCSREIPRDRLSMMDVVNELHKIRSCFLADER